MPIFTFTCPKCKKSFDLLLRIHEASESQFCEECGREMKHEVELPSKFVWGKSGGWS
jgi:putative FmdB family regulatory protein